MSLKSSLAKAVAIGAVLATASTGIASAAVSNHGTPVYRSPSYNSRIVNHLYRGEHVRLVDREGSWCRISISGPDGWVRCSALGNYPLNRFRPGITFNFGFGFPGFGYPSHPPMHPPGPPPHHSGPPPMHPPFPPHP